MGEAAEARAGRETWRDWLRAAGIPEPTDLITRAELLEQLAGRNIPVDERTLRHWENRGALPRPVRQWHRESTQALYPPWMAEVVVSIAQLRDHLPLRRTIGYGRPLVVDIARLHAEAHQTEEAIGRMEKPMLPEPVRAALLDYLAAHGGGTMEIAVRLHDGRYHTAWVEAGRSQTTSPTE